jgi:hypothetical protein
VQSEASQSSEQSALTPVLREQVGCFLRQWYCWGYLTISQGSVILTLGRTSRFLTGVSQVKHTDREIVLIRGRLMPPWFNSSLLLVGEDGLRAVASTWFRRRRRWKEALQDSGFTVREWTSWLIFPRRLTHESRWLSGLVLLVPTFGFLLFTVTDVNALWRYLYVAGVVCLLVLVTARRHRQRV